MTPLETLSRRLVEEAGWTPEHAANWLDGVWQKADAELDPQYKGKRRGAALMEIVRAKVEEQVPAKETPPLKEKPSEAKPVEKHGDWKTLIPAVLRRLTKDEPTTMSETIAALIEETGVTESTAYTRIRSFLGWTDEYERETVVLIKRVGK
jgi:hypothetical protein